MKSTHHPEFAMELWTPDPLNNTEVICISERVVFLWPKSSKFFKALAPLGL